MRLWKYIMRLFLLYEQVQWLAHTTDYVLVMCSNHNFVFFKLLVLVGRCVGEAQFRARDGGA